MSKNVHLTSTGIHHIRHEPPGLRLLRLVQSYKLPGPEDSPGKEGMHAEGDEYPSE